ncbi:MAG: protein phosphatase 2C domain-containing protein [Vicinamibacterales bacterium]
MKVHGISHAGTTRPHNEDAMTWDEELGFVAIADGMGGHQAGEVASRLALEAMLVYLRDSATAEAQTWPFGMDPSRSLTANRLSTALQLGNQRVLQGAEVTPKYQGMGTTVVALLAEGARVTFAGVGDSRLYAWKDGRLRQLTKDDSWLMLLANEPGMTPELLRKHPMRNVLTNVVGAKPELTVVISEAVLPGETLLLCSDGVHGSVPDDMMASIIGAESDLQRAARALIDTAMENKSTDNVTAVLVRIDDAA